jgi:hypothetical protein
MPVNVGEEPEKAVLGLFLGEGTVILLKGLYQVTMLLCIRLGEEHAKVENAFIGEKARKATKDLFVLCCFGRS